MEEQNKFLVIDDDDIFLFTASYVLKHTHPETQIITSKNGEEGLGKLQEINPSLIFVDLNMPVMGGWEFIDIIAQNKIWSSIPIIIVTSSIDPGDKKKASNHPLKPFFIEKPLTVDKIKALNL